MIVVSHPTWVCGLKHHTLRVTLTALGHTLRGCVDWNFLVIGRLLFLASHTLRGCVDWNHVHYSRQNGRNRHTLRGCVDWNDQLGMQAVPALKSHPTWVCGLKQIVRLDVQTLFGHTLRGCVDWNRKGIRLLPYLEVTPYVGVWIETAAEDEPS